MKVSWFRQHAVTEGMARQLLEGNPMSSTEDSGRGDPSSVMP